MTLFCPKCRRELKRPDLMFYCAQEEEGATQQPMTEESLGFVFSSPIPKIHGSFALVASRRYGLLRLLFLGSTPPYAYCPKEGCGKRTEVRWCPSCEQVLAPGDYGKPSPYIVLYGFSGDGKTSLIFGFLERLQHQVSWKAYDGPLKTFEESWRRFSHGLGHGQTNAISKYGIALSFPENQKRSRPRRKVHLTLLDIPGEATSRSAEPKRADEILRITSKYADGAILVVRAGSAKSVSQAIESVEDIADRLDITNGNEPRRLAIVCSHIDTPQDFLRIGRAVGPHMSGLMQGLARADSVDPAQVLWRMEATDWFDDPVAIEEHVDLIDKVARKHFDEWGLSRLLRKAEDTHPRITEVKCFFSTSTGVLERTLGIPPSPFLCELPFLWILKSTGIIA